MVKEAIEKILSLGKPNIHTAGDLQYSDKPLHLLVPPSPKALEVNTLTGFVQAIAVLGVPEVFVHVEDHGTVSLLDEATDDCERRISHLRAKCEEGNRFPFGSFISPEAFVIGLQANFVDTPDLKYVLRVASNLAAEAVSASNDDGISQSVSMRRGVVLKGEEVVKRIVTLAPYRTFREVEQPASAFLFRLRTGKEGELPACALFEADGGKWKLDAMQGVAGWVARNTKDIAVIS